MPPARLRRRSFDFDFDELIATKPAVADQDGVDFHGLAVDMCFGVRPSTGSSGSTGIHRI
jgi:hypothetical protein